MQRYNSEGNLIATTEEELKNFWRWFGNSKVVDEQGRPLVVYHGSRTEKDFTIFDKRYQKNKSSRIGFWFGTDIIDYGQNVKKYYIKLENPFIYNANKQVYNQIEEFDKTLLKDILISVFGQNIAITKYDTLLSDYLTYYAKKQGYDGVIINDIKEGNKAILMDDYVAFNPNQIKSVDNKGTFNPNSNNIYECVEELCKLAGIVK